jgi:hypothetical protein
VVHGAATSVIEARDLGLKQEEQKGTIIYYNLQITNNKNMIVAGVEVAGAEVAGVVVAGVEAVGSGVWSMTVGSARTPLSATTGCAGVATSVDSSVGNKMGSAGIDAAVASITFGGNGAVARHCFLPFASPQTQTTAFFLRTFPGVEQATDFPLAEMVAYQMLLVGVFAHTTDTLETFVNWPGFLQAVPATSVALRV